LFDISTAGNLKLFACHIGFKSVIKYKRSHTIPMFHVCHNHILNTNECTALEMNKIRLVES